MKKLLVMLGLGVLAVGRPAKAQVYKPEEPLAHTYSIVARDPKTGEMAVAVQSHWFSVGTSVSWGEAGVGVVATQSFTNKSFGLRGLALMKQGKTAQETLKLLLANDPGREVRQVAILDAKGGVATHTGKKCVMYAGHITGKDFSVQANMMLNESVWPAMAKAFERNSHLPLAERMLAVLDAAEAQGGDIRGRQSAALLVVPGKSKKEPWNERLVDLRVDDHEVPLQELRRLLTVQRAYEHMNNGDLAVEKNDMALAMKEYSAAERLQPNNLEMQYWHGITLANTGKVDEAIQILEPVFKADKNWRTLTERLPPVGLLTVSAADLQRILELK
ncbi:DUF1028 domain-containing protein [Rufibacter sediminis]|uniref:DUF1028 domain-containing protein n=1 Tax=Rufibacter sediminis TaxID=2762756 RepID=A0ABR6VRU1_9BACT|nr:DUF1028 domain-containing protein [Rufibacter sediminis]MBC3539877.1 DUF1028 domain-containing protein [Rufibacter sediminis]